MRPYFGWLVLVALLLTAGVSLSRQRDTHGRLEREVVAVRDRHRELTRLREENARLTAVLPSAGALENLRADHAAIGRLRDEIKAMQARLTVATDAPAAPGPTKFASGSKVPASEWRNAGSATPQATLETALWAAAGGDIDTFATCLLVPEGRIRQQATALLDRVPGATREQYGTPERLVAFLTMKDVPLGAAQLITASEPSIPGAITSVEVQVSGEDGKAKNVVLRFSNQGGSWKLMVPATALNRYAMMLQRPAGPR